MDRLLTIRRERRGCMLLDCGKPLAWYPSVAPALDLARTLADATALRDGTPARVQLDDTRRYQSGPPGEE